MTKFVDAESTIDCGVQALNNIIDFYEEESNRQDASLWYTFLSIFLVRKSGSHAWSEVSL